MAGSQVKPPGGARMRIEGVTYLVLSRVPIVDLEDWLEREGYQGAQGLPWPQVSFAGTPVLIVERKVHLDSL